MYFEDERDQELWKLYTAINELVKAAWRLPRKDALRELAQINELLALANNFVQEYSPEEILYAADKAESLTGKLAKSLGETAFFSAGGKTVSEGYKGE